MKFSKTQEWNFQKLNFMENKFHHKLLHPLKCRKKKLKFKKIHVFEPWIIYLKVGWPLSYSSRPQTASMFLCGHPNPFLGPLWNCTPILGGVNLYWRPFWASIGVDASMWGVNCYWRLFFGRQLWSTPFWGVDASIEGRQFSAPILFPHPSISL